LARNLLGELLPAKLVEELGLGINLPLAIAELTDVVIHLEADVIDPGNLFLATRDHFAVVPKERNANHQQDGGDTERDRDLLQAPFTLPPGGQSIAALGPRWSTDEPTEAAEEP
jgi:hypothetical protein